MENKEYLQNKLDWEAETKRLDELFQLFQQKYPSLYSKTHKDNFYIPKGWVKLITALSDILEPFEVECLQVKSKFCSLRFYVTESELVTSIIRDFELLSTLLCEDCGTPVYDSINEDMAGIRLCEDCKKINGRI